MTPFVRALPLFLLGVAVPFPGPAMAFTEPPLLADDVADGLLPPIVQRLPSEPAVVDLTGDRAPGVYGGELRMLASQPKDARMMVVYGYARLVGYDPSWTPVPDILKSLDVVDGRIFTMHLRKGHRWSDGQPFTAEDFRFYWDDVINNPELSPGGPERFLLAGGKPPRFDVLDETTVRYSWDAPNPFFIPALAGARPEDIFAPAHYLRQFHAKYRTADELKDLAKRAGQRNWVALFNLKSQQYRNDNPDLPSLEPWTIVTPPPSSRLVFTRNPYYYRVDTAGRQLPYIDSVAMSVVSAQLIAAKTAAGDADLQARGLGFENYTVLKGGEQRNDFTVRLWKSARGADLALYPNLTVSDPVWRALLRDPRFRRALSIAIDRKEINQVIYYGLALPGNDTVLPASPLYAPDYGQRWAQYDPAEANRLLDAIGLTDRDGSGIRRLPDGRRLELVVETAGEDPSQVAVLQLITDTWRDVGIQLLTKVEQRELLRRRAYAGETTMAVWYGLENALATATTPPSELAPTSQDQLGWPKWGQYYETMGRAGEAVDEPAAADLLQLYRAWIGTQALAAQTDIWHRMLQIRADNVFSIGTVRGVPQPVVVSNRLRNVPVEGIYNWEPGAFFGVYRPDTFWFADQRSPAQQVAR